MAKQGPGGLVGGQSKGQDGRRAGEAQPKREIPDIADGAMEIEGGVQDLPPTDDRAADAAMM